MNIVYKAGLPSKHDFSKLFDTTGWNRSYQATPEELEEAIDHSWFTVSAYDDVGSAILKKLVERCMTAGIRDIQLFSAAGTTDFYKKTALLKDRQLLQV
jgi:hypothetical protein